MIRDVVKSPWYTLTIAFMVLISGLLDIAEFACEHWFHTSIGVEHGAVIWGLSKALRALVDIFEGIEGIAPEQNFSELARD